MKKYYLIYIILSIPSICFSRDLEEFFDNPKMYIVPETKEYDAIAIEKEYSCYLKGKNFILLLNDKDSVIKWRKMVILDPNNSAKNLYRIQRENESPFIVSDFHVAKTRLEDLLISSTGKDGSMIHSSYDKNKGIILSRYKSDYEFMMTAYNTKPGSWKEYLKENNDYTPELINFLLLMMNKYLTYPFENIYKLKHKDIKALLLTSSKREGQIIQSFVGKYSFKVVRTDNDSPQLSANSLIGFMSPESNIIKRYKECAIELIEN